MSVPTILIGGLMMTLACLIIFALPCVAVRPLIVTLRCHLHRSLKRFTLVLGSIRLAVIGGLSEPSELGCQPV